MEIQTNHAIMVMEPDLVIVHKVKMIWWQLCLSLLEHLEWTWSHLTKRIINLLKKKLNNNTEASSGMLESLVLSNSE